MNPTPSASPEASPTTSVATSSAPTQANPLPLLTSNALLIRELHQADRPALLAHFLALSAEDRTLRFGQAIRDSVIEQYVEKLNFGRDVVFGIHDEQLHLMGVGHFSYLNETGDGVVAEFGVSIAVESRGRGVGTALFKRAAMHGRNTRVTTLYMHCLSRNVAMMHIARKAGMQVHFDGGEADAYLKLPPADSTSILTEAIQEQVADFDFALKRNSKLMRNLAHHWRRVIAPSGLTSTR